VWASQLWDFRRFPRLDSVHPILAGICSPSVQSLGIRGVAESVLRFQRRVSPFIEWPLEEANEGKQERRLLSAEGASGVQNLEDTKPNFSTLTPRGRGEPD
jgi:hypothetical protein